MVHTVQTEIERKFAVDEAAVLPELNGVGGGVGSAVVSVRTEEPVQLEAVYYDTAEVALARNRIALRRREGGHDGGWHVKLPAEEGRMELQWPLDVDSAPHAPEKGDSDDPASPSTSTSTSSPSPSTVVPSIVVDTVRVHVRDRPLTPLAQLQTTRTVTNLLDASGAVVVELSDDTVRATDSREGTVRLWREWEAELGPAAPDTVEGRTALLDELGERLLAAGATVSPSLSKLAQALGRSGLDEPAGDGGTPSDPVASTLRAGVTELVERMIALDPAVRTDEFDAVHRFRTTVRRLRTALAVHARALAPAPELRESLSMLGSVLGEVRDLEVQAERAEFALDELESERGIADKDAQRRLVEQTLDERAAAHERLVAFLSAPRYYRLLDALEDFVADVPAAEAASSSPSPPSASGKQASGKGAQKAAQKSARKAGRKAAGKAVQKAGRRALRRSVPASVAQQALADDIVEASRATGALHSSRKAARRLRYVAEFSSEGAAAVLGGGIDEVADAAEELQDALGWHRDAALFAEFVLLTARRAEAEGESGFTYGVLYQRAIDQSRRALDLAADARRTLKRTL